MLIKDIQHKSRKENWYYDIYDIFLNNYPEDANLLEIGVQSGESLKMWQKVFPKGKIVGADIDPNCGKPEGTQVYIGDQTDRMFLKSIIDDHGSFDIIIDDGGHTMEQQIETFKNLFSCVTSGGLYVIEDLHTSYWPQFGGGYGKANTAVEFLKDLVDSLNYEAMLSHRAAEFQKTLEPVYPISGIHFYKSLVFIEKA